MRFKRITPEEVVEAYKATGLKPISGKFVRRFHEGHCGGCAITAVTIHKAGWTMEQVQELASDPEAEGWHPLQLSEAYMRGFIIGFDRPLDVRLTPSLGAYDGRAARQAVEAEFGCTLS